MAESISSGARIRRAKAHLILAEMRRLGFTDEQIRQTLIEAADNCRRSETVTAHPPPAGKPSN